MSSRTATMTLAACLLSSLGTSGQQADVFDRVQHGYAVSEAGVRIHYATLGTGPLVVMIHGFPDFWYTWRHQMAVPKVTVPVLMFHGLGDRALHRNGLAGTWEWLEKDLTLVTVPGAGHFVQQDAADLVTSTMKWWLAMRAR